MRDSSSGSCELIDVVVEKALKSAKVVMSDISAIEKTAGPGLVGGVCYQV